MAPGQPGRPGPWAGIPAREVRPPGRRHGGRSASPRSLSQPIAQHPTADQCIGPPDKCVSRICVLRRGATRAQSRLSAAISCNPEIPRPRIARFGISNTPDYALAKAVVGVEARRSVSRAGARSRRKRRGTEGAQAAVPSCPTTDV